MRSSLSVEGQFLDALLLTLDVDWSPDFCVDFVAEKLIEQGVRATWFITHLSPAIERLRHHSELFELGIHPNFLPGSTHGDTPLAVLQHCMDLVPEATSVRTHGLVQSSMLLEQIMFNTPIKTDLSLFLPRAKFVQPVEYCWRDKMLLRVPYCWEDDYEMGLQESQWNLPQLLNNRWSLKVLNFHPIHLYLNSLTLEAYEQIKCRGRRLNELTPQEAAGVRREGMNIGTLAFFDQIVDYLSRSAGSLCVRDIVSLDPRWGRNKR